MKKNILIGLCLFVLNFTNISLAATPNQQISRYTLKNGLQLIVKVDKRAPVVISQVWYKVGSSYEPNGMTGVSHVLEHMMFDGTKHYPKKNQFSQIIAKNGGKLNAFTSYDFTAYFEELAASRLPISFKLEAERMQYLSLTSKAFAKEIQVVQEERRLRYDNDPQALTQERFMAASYIASPYHHPVIGWMSDLQNMTIANVRSWYQQWYAPNNAIVVVVGDVVPKHVYQLAKKYFGPIPAHQLPIIKPHKALKPLGKRSLTVNAPAKLAWLIMGYNVPSLKTAKPKWHAYALAVLAGILDEGDSARLQKDLVRGQEIASGASVNYGIYSRLATLFTIEATPSQGHTVNQVQQAILTEINKLKTKPVSQKELEQVKTQVIAQKIYAKDSIMYQALQIGMVLSVGLPIQAATDYVAQIEKITPQQIQAVAKKYLVTNRLTVAHLQPLPLKVKRQPSPVQNGIKHAIH